ncbi:MAG: hypothetical protein IJ647_10830 [Prevotella sp.]|nr:hypothetical protein [Prevotella sp.]
MSKEEDKGNVYNQMAWILNYQPTIKEQHIHMGDKSAEVYQGVNTKPSDEEKQEEEANTHAEEPKKPQEELNFFAPKKNLQELLKQAWFAEVRTDKKYDATWTDAFIEALMASEYGEGIARQWAVKGARNKRNQLKAYVVGLLKDAGVLKGSYDAIATMIDPNDKKRTLATNMSRGKKQPYADWVKGYVTGKNENVSENG